MWELCVPHRKHSTPSLTRFYGERTIVDGLLFAPGPSFEKQRKCGVCDDSILAVMAKTLSLALVKI